MQKENEPNIVNGYGQTCQNLNNILRGVSRLSD